MMLRCFGVGPVVEHAAVDLAGQVQQDADFVLERGNQFGLRQDHGNLGGVEGEAGYHGAVHRFDSGRSSTQRYIATGQRGCRAARW